MLQRSRILAVATLRTVFFLFLGLVVALFFLQVIQRPQYVERIQRYFFKSAEIEVPRGAICDAQGEVLADTIPALDVWALTRDVDKPWTEKNEKIETAELLAPHLGRPVREVYATLCRSGYRPLARKIIDPDVILQLFELKRRGYLRGIDLQRHYCRHYPHEELLGHVVGFVDFEGKGIFGIEAIHDDYLSGWAGKRVFRKDGVQNEIYCPDEQCVEGAPGGDLFLTIDSAIQLFTEYELAKIDHKFHPKWSAAVVMEPATGRILATASYPPLKPSAPGEGPGNHWMNRPFAAEYIPGSTFKPIFMAMALDRGVVGLNDMIDCEGGRAVLHGRTISDVHRGYSTLDPTGILIQSSNVGMSKIALRFVPERTPKGSPAFQPTRDMLSLLGLGKRPNVLQRGQESPGTITDLKDWSRVYTQISLSFGNEIAVTPIQMAAAFSTLVNGGCYMPPRLVDRMVTAEGREISPPRAPARRVFSEATCQAVKEMLVQVVEQGSGKKARVPGYRVGGKTGTAEKLPAKTEVTSSFIAFSPLKNPALVVLVVVDEPQKVHYASQVAAPHVKAILERCLSHLGIVCDGDDKEKRDREKRDRES